MWMLLVLVYGLLKGAREAVKKKCLQKNSVPEVLFFYTLIGFIFLLPESKDVLNFDLSLFPLIIVKSVVIFIAWILSFKVIKNIPIGIYGILDMSRVLFAYFFGIVLLNEKLTVFQMIGMPLVLIGLFMLRIVKGEKDGNEKIETKYVVLAIVSCMLNAVSGFFDKIIMRRDISSGQLQFFYMLVLVVLYGLYLVWDRKEINFSNLKTNYWIVVLALMFVVADRCLFIANAYENSRITVMTLIKQSSCFVTIILGKIIYKEKDLRKQLICAFIVFAGIVIAVLR